MDLQKIAIVTISLVRDQHEEELLRLSLKALSSLGIPVFITDAGSPESFVNYISQLANFNVLKAKGEGLWAQAETSLQHAANSCADFIFYTEPDKLDFFRLVPAMLGDIQINQNTGVILTSRTPAGLASFPAFQQMTETTINNCCAEIIGQEVDYTYGPFLLNASVVPHLRSLPGDIGWGWRTYAFSTAARLGLEVTAYAGDYLCNKSAEEDEASERQYRMTQLVQNIRGLLLSAINDF